jgi:hypothetical protein
VPAGRQGNAEKPAAFDTVIAFSRPDSIPVDNRAGSRQIDLPILLIGPSESEQRIEMPEPTSERDKVTVSAVWLS